MTRKVLDISSGFKTCPGCKIRKPVGEFSVSRATLHGLSVYCKSCSFIRHRDWRIKNKAKAAADQKRWRQENPRQAKDAGLKRRYKIEFGTYDRMLAQQNGCCAICRADKAGGKGGDFHVDHCHETGKVRGLLCHGCNVSIGHFHNDPAILHAAIRYLAEGAVES